MTSSAPYGAVPVRYDQDWVSEVRRLALDGVAAALETAGAGVLPQLIELAGGVQQVVMIADVVAQQLGVRLTAGGPGDRAWESLEQLASLAPSGKADLPIDRRYALIDAGAVHANFESGHRSGNLILTV